MLLPVIAGLSYELIRFAAKRRGVLLAALTAPGLWLQRITTKPPPTSRRRSRFTLSMARWRSKKKQGGELVIA